MERYDIAIIGTGPAGVSAALTATNRNKGIPVTEKRIGAVYAMGDYFALQAGEEMLEARTVILATGVVSAKPLPGEEALLGRGVSYCATCDAPLYRGRTAAVIGYSPREEAEAAFLGEVCSELMAK